MQTKKMMTIRPKMAAAEYPLNFPLSPSLDSISSTGTDDTSYC